MAEQTSQSIAEWLKQRRDYCLQQAKDTLDGRIRAIWLRDVDAFDRALGDYADGVLVNGTSAEIANAIAERDIVYRSAPEAAAREIYEGWKGQTGWVPWVEGGNSLMQDKARRAAADDKRRDARGHVLHGCETCDGEDECTCGGRGGNGR